MLLGEAGRLAFADRERYLACGMNDYLAKPVDIAALGRAVARAAAPRRSSPA